jgi:hypothetical protein
MILQEQKDKQIWSCMPIAWAVIAVKDQTHCVVTQLTKHCLCASPSAMYDTVSCCQHVFIRAGHTGFGCSRNSL